MFIDSYVKPLVYLLNSDGVFFFCKIYSVHLSTCQYDRLSVHLQNNDFSQNPVICSIFSPGIIKRISVKFVHFNASKIASLLEFIIIRDNSATASGPETNSNIQCKDILDSMIRSCLSLTPHKVNYKQKTQFLFFFHFFTNQ